MSGDIAKSERSVDNKDVLRSASNGCRDTFQTGPCVHNAGTVHFHQKIGVAWCTALQLNVLYRRLVGYVDVSAKAHGASGNVIRLCVPGRSIGVGI